jgi:CheY-like chemotaxis protein
MSEKNTQPSIKQVLIVDNNEALLMSLKEGLAKYRSQFSVLLANDGREALEILQRESVSVVVSDVKMPKMNGLELLSNITNAYPDIPVIIMTAYGREELEWMARKSGAVAFISKPFRVSDVSNKLLTLLKQESEGGVIRSISAGVFFQLAEMEEMTCTIRVHTETDETVGVVFFRDGKLFDARYGSQIGEEALFMILALEGVQIRIQSSCPPSVQSKIDLGLQAILLEAMRLKDEADSLEIDEPENSTQSQSLKNAVASLSHNASGGSTQSEHLTESTPAASSSKKNASQKTPSVKKKSSAKDFLLAIQKRIGKKIGVGEIYFDRSWEHSVTLSLKVGDMFGAGRLQCGYIQRKNDHPIFFIPGSPSAILKVDRLSPRDRMFSIVRKIN